MLKVPEWGTELVGLQAAQPRPWKALAVGGTAATATPPCLKGQASSRGRARSPGNTETERVGLQAGQRSRSAHPGGSFLPKSETGEGIGGGKVAPGQRLWCEQGRSWALPSGGLDEGVDAGTSKALQGRWDGRSRISPSLTSSWNTCSFWCGRPRWVFPEEVGLTAEHIFSGLNPRL